MNVDELITTTVARVRERMVAKTLDASEDRGLPGALHQCYLAVCDDLEVELRAAFLHYDFSQDSSATIDALSACHKWWQDNHHPVMSGERGKDSVRILQTAHTIYITHQIFSGFQAPLVTEEAKTG